MRNTLFVVALSAACLVAPLSPIRAEEPKHFHAGLKPAAQSADLPAPLFRGLGNNVFKISTDSRLAQVYFDQGLMLANNFNHAEAARSFRAAQVMDQKCAMAYWGEAYALGPNINAPMFDDNVPLAWAAIRKALDLKKGVSQREKDLIDAMALRYVEKPGKDRAELDAAYRDAMRIVAKRYPTDPDIQVLFAEAIMDTTPWHYWTDDGKPGPLTPELVTTIESVLAKYPRHAGAIHLYIHAVEASPNPDRAERYADTLSTLIPDAGHLVHMPGHIYVRVGRWHDACITNENAIASDESYIAQCKAQGFYPALYYSHNMHFLWYAASMEGRSRVALAAAKKMATHVKDSKATCLFPDPGFWANAYWLGQVQFGKWNEIAMMTEPAKGATLEEIVFHYCRGMALARTGKADDAMKHAAKLRELVATETVKKMTSQTFPGEAVMQIKAMVLDGEIAWARGDKKGAIATLEKAVAAQDALPYMEPPFFYYPTRHTLGAMLLENGQAAEAEKHYREDLKESPKNGWSLYGLFKSLDAQGKKDEARAVEAEFKEIWKHADVKLTGSRF